MKHSHVHAYIEILHMCVTNVTVFAIARFFFLLSSSHTARVHCYQRINMSKCGWKGAKPCERSMLRCSRLAADSRIVATTLNHVLITHRANWIDQQISKSQTLYHRSG